MKSIEVSELTKFYGPTKALNGISFNLEKSEVLAFLGPNGAGKTTTMKIITCYLKQTAGEVKVNNLNILENPVIIKKMIGYLPESTPLYGDMIVYDFLEFVGKIHSMPKNLIKNRIKEMADVCGINEVINKRVDQLSKGYRQRVGLAYAMIHDPEILILDEPTSGLDPNQIIEIRELIKELGKKKSVILSTHILSEAEATADRAIIIDKGNIVADGTVKEIRKQHQKNLKILVKLKKDEYIKNIEEIKDKFNLIDSIVEIKINFEDDIVIILELTSIIDNGVWEEIYSICKNENYTVYEIKEKELSLEEIFIHLTNPKATVL